MRSGLYVLLVAAAIAGASCVSCSGGHTLGFASNIPKLTSDRRVVQLLPLRRSNVPMPMQLSMKEKVSKVNVLQAFAKRIAQGAVILSSLAIGLSSPQRASAKVNQYGVSSDGQFYNYAPKQASAPYGAAAGLTALTFGGMCAVAIKREKATVAEAQDNIEKELDRLLQYKQEFLDGVPSDRSIYASLAKAMTKDVAPAKPAKQEDEFEKNVRAFLEEEEAKNQKKQADKKKADGMGKGPSSALLERPGDTDGSKTEAWMNDIVIDDKPASIAAEDLQRLQRMFGGDLPKL